MWEFRDSNGNGFGDIWWTDKLINFSRLDSMFKNQSSFLEKRRPVLSPVHTSDADEPPAATGTHFQAYENRTGSNSGVCRRRFHAHEYPASRRQY